MKGKKTVAMLIPPRISHLEQVATGIVNYARDHGGWAFAVWPDRYTVSVGNLEGWGGDGAIVFIDAVEEAEAASRLNIPVVNISGGLQKTGLPRVGIDNWAIGLTAAKHLLLCGFRRFAYYGISNLWYSRRRAEAFQESVEKEGGKFSCFLVKGIDAQQPWHGDDDDLLNWIKTLEPPIGMMACDDYRARKVCDACREVGLDVPGDVAIVGVDNSSIICEFGEPTLSSVSRNGMEEGYQAASLLNRLMEGEKPPAEDIFVPPSGVVQRQSTDTVCADDVHLIKAVRYIRANIDKPFDVKQLVAKLSISRRYIETGFQRLWGISPRQYIDNLRVERAKHLISGIKNPKITNVAKDCGFNNVSHLRRVFKRHTGMSPQDYRRQCQNQDTES